MKTTIMMRYMESKRGHKCPQYGPCGGREEPDNYPSNRTCEEAVGSI